MSPEFSSQFPTEAAALQLITFELPEAERRPFQDRIVEIISEGAGDQKPAWVEEYQSTDSAASHSKMSDTSDQSTGRPLSREELIRELEAELNTPILPPSDWKARVTRKLELSRKLLRESPMGRGRI